MKPVHVHAQMQGARDYRQRVIPGQAANPCRPPLLLLALALAAV
ncbi:hypothetical protein [Erwinia sp. PsM31]|nr:hypothetical protein [Erwinia sp. PsM31]MDN4626247.1 hypothetical protein [Erwinia sp. PsM31]